MATQSLYRRYRPRRFSEVKGQDHVVRALRNAVAHQREGQAYLFSGPRGTGKTTSARILAKVLNCENPLDGEPCCECASCLAVESGTSFDVLELDSASNGGVEAIRELREKAVSGTPGRHKVFILDEVHMLSKPAEAALLKTLEEPPPHVVFILATTDPQKVSETIRSRTQHLQFHLLPMDELEAHVRWVIEDAGLEVAEGAVEAVLQRGGGSARDTLSALEVVAASGGVAPEDTPLDEFVEALIEADSGRALAAAAASIHQGRDARTLTEALIAHLRDCFLSLMAPDLVQLPDHRAEEVSALAQRLGAASTVRAIETLGSMLVDMRHAPDPRVMLEVALVKLTSASADPSVAALAARIEKLEHALARAGATGGRAAAESPSTAPSGAGPTGAPARADAPGGGSADERASSASSPDATSGGPAGATGRAVLGARARRPDAPAEPDPPANPLSESSSPPLSTPAPAPAPAGEVSAAPAAPIAPPASEPPVRAAPAAPPPQDETPTPIGSTPTPSTSTGPSRDQLTLAWADEILVKLRPIVRAVFGAGRFVDGSDGAIAFAVPNEPHRRRCDEHRADVEKAIAAHFGTPVRLVLVVDGGSPGATPSPGARPAPPPDEDVDLSELVDAPKETPMTSVERIAAAFPGSELVDEDD